jgi:hypothetical protein
MTDLEEAVKSPEYYDRKAGLVFFGILQIILGVICAIFVLLMIITMIKGTAHANIPARSVSAGEMMPGVMLYALAAVWLIWMGIGSIKVRRWARTLILVSSWLWLVTGIIALGFMLLFMTDVLNEMGRSGQISQADIATARNLMIGFQTLIFLIIPGLLVLFYGRKNVKATCEHRDPQIRWTDKCPLPVLAVSGMSGFGAVSMLLGGFTGWVFPFFGIILSGVAGAAVITFVSLLCGYIAWGTYKLNIKAWWYAVLVCIAGALSIGITFSRVSILDFYEKMNMPAENLEFFKQSLMQHKSAMVIFFLFNTVGFLGYLLYTRRYFTPSSKTESASREQI